MVAATVAFGMGVDIPDIRQVIHYHLPSSLESYYQEAGRAGRDGDPATCLLLWRAGDRDLQSFLIERSFEERGSDDARRNAYARLQQALGYAQLRTCRHARIGDYFGEQGVPRRCQACDNCTRPAPDEVVVAVEAVMSALGAIRRLGGRLGAANLAAILGGRFQAGVVRRDHADGQRNGALLLHAGGLAIAQRPRQSGIVPTRLPLHRLRPIPARKVT